ncbi:MAG: PKD domain-containing protein [Bacteroidales bacterium]|nr:PKD domain-containing protein [Bacteroidales bacterium]
MKYFPTLLILTFFATNGMALKALPQNYPTADSCQSYFSVVITNNSADFTAYSMSPYTTIWEWDFGDGETDSGQTTQHIYNTTGDFLVTLYTADSFGCSYTYSSFITIGQPPDINAEFSYLVDPGNPLLFHFTDLSTENIIAWEWDFGDGQQSNAQNPSHQYLTEGDYQVCLTVYSCYEPQCGDSICKTVMAQPGQYHSLAGQIFSGMYPAWPCQIWLYQKKATGLSLMDSTFTSNIGAYYFYGIPAGRYILKAEPLPGSNNYTKYLPTYSGNKALWSMAQEINLYTNIFNSQIMLIANPDIQKGYANISGGIFYGNNLSDITSDPAQRIPILLLGTNNNLLKFTYSDSLGNFSFKNIPYGDYKILPEYTGKSAIAYQLTLTAAAPTASNIVFTIREMSITYGIDENTVSISRIINSMYPNPARDQIFIKPSANHIGNILLRFITPDGRQVFIKDISPGQFSEALQLNGLSNGLYYVIISDKKAHQQIMKIIIQ